MFEMPQKKHRPHSQPRKDTIMNTRDFDTIAELDLEPIKVKLMHEESGEGWSLERANAVEFEYRRFLYLMKKFPQEQTAPLQDVDTFWHYHILDTLKYATDCQAVFGYFLHHFPYIGLRGEEDEEAHHRVGERMKELYEATFNEPYIRAGRAGTAFSGAPADGAQTAFSGAAVRTAFSGAARGSQQIAFSGAPGARMRTAFSGAPGSAQVAFSGAPGGAQVAFSGAPGGAQVAFSGAPGGAQVAFSGAPGGAQVAFSGAPGGAKVAFSGAPAGAVRAAFSGAPAGRASVAFSGSPQVAPSAMPAAQISADKFYAQRPRLTHAG
jgi:hypothetical protein